MRLKNTMIGITAAAALAAGAPHDAGAQKKRAPGPQKPCSSAIVKKGNPEGCSVKKNENEIEGMECDIAIPGNRFRRVSFSGVFLAGIKDSDLGAVIATNMVRAAEGKIEREGCVTKATPDFVPDKGAEPPEPLQPPKGKPKPAEPTKPAAPPEAGKQKPAEPQKPPAPKEPTGWRRAEPPKPAGPQKPAGQKADDDGDVVIPPKPGIAPPQKPKAPQEGPSQADFKAARELMARIAAIRRNKDAMKMPSVASKIAEAEEILKNPRRHSQASFAIDDAESYFQRSQDVRKRVAFNSFDYSKPILPFNTETKTMNEAGFKFDLAGSRAAVKQVMSILQEIYNELTRNSAGGSAGGKLSTIATVNVEGQVTFVVFTSGPGVLMNNRDKLSRIAEHIGRLKFDTSTGDPKRKPKGGMIELTFVFQGR